MNKNVKTVFGSILILSAAVFIWNFPFKEDKYFYIYTEEESKDAVGSAISQNNNINDILDFDVKDVLLDVPVDVLEEYYGDYKIIDNVNTNRYRNISKSYTAEDIHKNFSIHSDGVVIDGFKLEEPVINIGRANEHYFSDTPGLPKELGFSNESPVWFSVKDRPGDDIYISCCTDGEIYYYVYGGNFLIMEKAA
ncbi:MAG: hypothetical protein LUD81_07430 [Clostridiales bacterium]|nr:hypothetical protein [Clostridiales bacterium]